MRLRSPCAIYGSLAAIASFLSYPALAAPPPASAYAETPNAGSARMSPDGKSVAYVDGQGDELSIMISAIDGNKLLPVPTGDWNPKSVSWKDNQTLLVRLDQTAIADSGYPYPIGQLMAMSADGAKALPLRFVRKEDPGSTMSGNGASISNLSDQMVSDLPSLQNQILVEVGDRAYDYPSVYNVDLWDDAKHVVVRTQPGVTGWEADQNGIVRAGYSRSETNQAGVYDHQIVARTSETDGWHTYPFRADDLAFSATDPSVLYALLTPDSGLASVVQIDIPTGTIKSTLTSGPKGTLWLDADEGVLDGYGTTTQSGSVITYVDPAKAADAAAIAQALKIPNLALIDHSADGKRITALVRTPGQPDALWLLDRSQSPPALNPLLTDYEDVPASSIATGKWGSFTARDGLNIPVLVTLPVGAPNAPIPFVVLPYSGPASRDVLEFNWLVQFLVSRGYGVLQPQFRGSTGYGADFESAGKQQWGLAMQNDVTDATRWLVSQKLALPNKICIAGAGYGGYAALEGAEKEPSLYACAASIAGISDLPAWIAERNQYAFSDTDIANIGGNTGALAAVSPDRHADKLQIPVLLIAPTKDWDVPIEQTKKMEAALKAAGKTEQTLYLPDADFYRPAARLAELNALETFLAQNLKTN